MSSETEIDNKYDCFLREIPNVKVSQDAPKKNHPELKTEMQLLRLSDTSEKLVMDTLKYVHGEDFLLDDISSYKNQKSNLEHKYWMDRGNLVIKGAVQNSEDSYNTLPKDKFRMFAISRLESYGFHKKHCEEALDYCNGEVNLALELLYQKYYKKERRKSLSVNYSRDELFEHMLDEKNVLMSIYENIFEEKIANSVWIFKLKLNYLIEMYSNKAQVVKKPVNNVKKKEMCRNFVKGIECKFGNKCRFSHEVEVKEDPNPVDSHLRKNEFELEIRFPEDSYYPYEPPLIFLKSDANLPEQLCLHVCRRLIKEAEDFTKDGMVCVYSIVELINNDEEIISFLKSNRELFISEKEMLFPSEKYSYKSNVILPSHYKKGLTSKDAKNMLTNEEIIKEDQNLVKLFSKKKYTGEYIKMLEKRRQLPVWNYMKDILNTIRSSQVVVISGETGCGKSTQVPQFLLDDWFLNYNNNHIEIICTQPRRISAIGVSERVAYERLEKIGKTIGYQIRLENKISSSTRLTFCTTGILLRRLESDPNISSVSHIIVDEVHERSEESDFLLLILKDLLVIRPDLKVILMSATMNANIFCDYFGDVPIFEIPGRTFPVEQLFLEDILEISDYVLEENTQYTRNLPNGENFESALESCEVLANNIMPKSSVKDDNLTLPMLCARYKGFSKKTCRNLYLMDSSKINLDLIESILTWIVLGNHEYPKEGSILVFLPGISEITSLYEQLCDNPELNPRYGKYVLLPLHSTLTSEEQSEIFKKPKNNARKIILSTNIAETSVTIDDCVYVIDTGKMKEKRFDANKNMESLEMVWTSRANALQRKGRAGRVMPGVCIHLFTSNRFNHHLLMQPVPELHRVPLEQLLLRIKILPNFENRSVYEVLGATIEPPSLESIDSAVLRLQDVGALDEQQKLTSLGLHLAALPVDVRIGKLMLFGAIFCCVDSVLTIAACLSYKTPFVTPFGKKDLANNKKKNFSTANSDQLTVLKAYKKWQETLKRSRAAANVFAQENYLSSKTLTTLGEIKYQYLELLISIGFIPVDLVSQKRSTQDRILELTGPKLNINGENSSLLSAILCAALYPNVCKVLTPGKSYIMSAVGAVPKQTKAEELRFKTKQDGYVHLHPSSVIATVGHFPSPYIIYQEKIKTSRLFIRDCCMVPLLPLVLFSGCNLLIEVHNGQTILSLEDGWIIFQVDKHEVAEMLKRIRIDLFELLDEKIRDPCLNLLHHERGKKIISTIIHIITND